MSARSIEAIPKHPLADKKVKLNVSSPDNERLNGKMFQVEDWVVNINKGDDWDRTTNYSTLGYAKRMNEQGHIDDKQVVYGHIVGGEKDGIGYIVHCSELEGYDGGSGTG